MNRVGLFQWMAAVVLAAVAQAAASQAVAEPALTIYNQDFAVVRETLPLDLKKGVNDVRVADITAHLEPDSVILRDPAGKLAVRILEQNYRADPVSEGLLLNLYEGQEISFLVEKNPTEKNPTGQEVVKGKIVRSGYVPHQAAMRRYGQEYAMSQRAFSSPESGSGQPIIEVDGQLRFSLPGRPLFPALKDDTILKPTLQWQLESETAGKAELELAYVTGGMSWEADYNLVAPEKGDLLDVLGWVTMDNQSGKSFEAARINLMAGDVSKIQRGNGNNMARNVLNGSFVDEIGMRPPVSEKAFDEYHLYTLNRTTTLHDRETKQVEFVRAAGVQSERMYIYDGAQIDFNRYGRSSYENIRQERDYGTQSNPKVWVMREFKNSEKNGLGIPLPKGRVRFYRRDDDGRLEFTGENVIDHTPKDETVRVYTGNAFDLVGERKRTDYKMENNGGRNWVDESFQIKVRNRKEKDAVEVRVAERLYRWFTWEIVEKSQDFTKTDSQTVEFRVQLEPGEEKTITYKVHYAW